MLKVNKEVNLDDLLSVSRYELIKGFVNDDKHPIIIWTNYDKQLDCSTWISSEDYYTTLDGVYELIKDGLIFKEEN